MYELLVQLQKLVVLQEETNRLLGVLVTKPEPKVVEISKERSTKR